MVRNHTGGFKYTRSGGLGFHINSQHRDLNTGFLTPIFPFPLVQWLGYVYKAVISQWDSNTNVYLGTNGKCQGTYSVHWAVVACWGNTGIITRYILINLGVALRGRGEMVDKYLPIGAIIGGKQCNLLASFRDRTGFVLRDVFFGEVNFYYPMC